MQSVIERLFRFYFVLLMFHNYLTGLWLHLAMEIIFPISQSKIMGKMITVPFYVPLRCSNSPVCRFVTGFSCAGRKVGTT